MKISAAICIYNDFDFINECIDRVYDFVDEIVILDGPYHYCEPILRYFGLFYDQPPDALKRILSLPKVRYEYRMFDDERAKRIALYEMCRFDIVMLLDADELIVDIRRDALDAFIASDMKVAPALFSNHVRSTHLINKPSNKFIFFKREAISASEHLNYTWLVGVNQEPPDRALMYFTPVMTMAHLTLMRSPYFSVVKYCFYTRLYFYSRSMHDQLDRLHGLPFLDLSDRGLSPVEAGEIFRRSLPALVNFPEQAPLHVPAADSLAASFDQRIGLSFLDRQQRVLMLDSVESFHYLQLPTHLRAGDAVHFSFIARETDAVDVDFLVHSGEQCIRIAAAHQNVDGAEIHGSFILPHDPGDLFGVLICFKARCGNRIGVISDFVIKRHFGIYGNCQTENLRDFLMASAAFRREYIFEETPGRLVHMMSEDDVAAFHEKLHRVDYLIAQPISHNFRGSQAFRTEAVLERLRPEARVLMLPNLFFTGYAPDAYCVTYRKQFMREPMPIHDINFIYSYLRRRGRRDAVRADYERKLADPSFYSEAFVQSAVERNINELAAREAEARQRFGQPNIRFFSYSAFVSAWHDKALLHYSDAHPTEFVFQKLAEDVLTKLGLDTTLAPVTVGEKGVVPFYASIGSALGFDAREQPIYVNDTQVTFDQFLNDYCDAYDEIDPMDLAGYISGHMVKIIITNHKTGTVLMRHIVRNYCRQYQLRLLDLNRHMSANGDHVDPNIDFSQFDVIFMSHAQHFEQLIGAEPNLRYRAIHLIRNPFEIIMSGVRYHQITDEPWCNKKIFVKAEDGTCGFRRVAGYDVGRAGETGETSYREIMLGLSPRERIEFEIRNHATTFGTIPEILRFLRRFQDDGNVSTIHLEDVATDACITHVFRFLNLDNEFQPAYRRRVGTRTWAGNHVTDAEGVNTHEDAFDDALYQLFHAEFGWNVLARTDYGDDPPPPGSAGDPSADGEWADAIAAANRPDDPLAIPVHGTAADLHAAGDRLLNMGELELSLQAFEMALEKDDRSIATLGRLGDVNVMLGHYEDAITCLRRIGELTDDPPVWMYVILANAHEALNQPVQAIASLRQALALVPDDNHLRIRLDALDGVGAHS